MGNCDNSVKAGLNFLVAILALLENLGGDSGMCFKKNGRQKMNDGLVFFFLFGRVEMWKEGKKKKKKKESLFSVNQVHHF